MTAVREPILSALFALVTNAYAWNAPPSRRLALWDKVAPESMPTLYQFEGGEDEYVWEEDLLLRRTLSVRLFAYVNTKDSTIVGATAINTILDALDTALTPSTAQDQITNRLSLGGLVSSCRISGRVLKDPGDLDGIGLIVAPVLIVLPLIRHWINPIRGRRDQQRGSRHGERNGSFDACGCAGTGSPPSAAGAVFGAREIAPGIVVSR